MNEEANFNFLANVINQQSCLKKWSINHICAKIYAYTHLDLSKNLGRRMHELELEVA